MSQATVDELRALHAIVKAARAKRNEDYEVLLRLGEELSLCEPPEAWTSPKPPETEEARRTDPRIFWLHYSAIGPRTVDDGSGGMREYRGAMYHPGHESAPARGERGQWCVASSVAVQGKKPDAKPWEDRDDGEPKNIELGGRIHAAWKQWSDSGGAAEEAAKAYEVALRAHVEAP